MQLMHGSSARYGSHVRLPDDLSMCARLRFIDLSYSSFQSLPSAWKAITTLECVDLSYNQELRSVPDWLGERNERLWSLSVLGCPRLYSIPNSALDRLSKSSVVEDFLQAYKQFHDVIRGMQVGFINVVAYCIPEEAKTEWSFAKFFLHLARNALMHRRCSRWSEVLKVSARSILADEVEVMYSSWFQESVDEVFKPGGAGDGDGSSQTVEPPPRYIPSIVLLHQSGLIVVDDGFDMGEPNFMQ